MRMMYDLSRATMLCSANHSVTKPMQASCGLVEAHLLGKKAGVMNERRSGVEYLAGHDVDDGDCMLGSYDQTSSVSSQAYADAVQIGKFGVSQRHTSRALLLSSWTLPRTNKTIKKSRCCT